MSGTKGALRPAVEELGLLHRIVRAVLPSRARFVLYYQRQALASSGAERRENLARMYSYLGWYRHNVTVHGDVRMAVDLRDEGIAMPLWVGGDYEPEETTFLRSVLRSSDVFVDIGANIGVYTTLAAKCVGPGGRVVAFEPGPYNYSLLTHNINRNGFKNVTPLQMALGDSPGTATLNVSKKNYGDNRIGEELRQLEEFDSVGVQVNTDTLDNVLRRLKIDRVDCIKMDVQGFEAYVLDGMVETIAHGVSTISTEFWPTGIRTAGKDPVLYLKKYKDMGFKASIITEEGVKPIEYDRVFDAIPQKTRADGQWVNLAFQR
jgi:FkbM family methyltransferase